MDEEAVTEFCDLLCGLTAEETQWVVDRAVIGISLRGDEMQTLRGALEVCTSEAFEAILETLKGKSPGCYCGHKKIFHEIGGYRCAVPNCQCMCFHEANPI